MIVLDVLAAIALSSNVPLSVVIGLCSLSAYM